MFYGYVKKYDQAITQFNQGLKVASDKRPLLRAISVAQRQKGDMTASVKTAESLVQQPKSGIEDKFYLATLYQDSRKTAEAMKLYSAIVAERPEHAAALNNLAVLLADAGKPAEALAHAQKAASLAPENPSVLDTYGWILVQQGKTQDGLETLKKAAGLSPSNPTILYHLAVAHEKSGQQAEALGALDRAVSVSTSFPEYRDAEKLRAQLQKQKK
jgi:tetratricopeptide (TPR) repeat protein